MVDKPYSSPQRRKGIRSCEMPVRSGNRESSSSFQDLNYAEEDETAFSLDDDDLNIESSKPVKVKDNSGPGGSRLTCEAKRANQNNSKGPERRKQTQKAKTIAWPVFVVVGIVPIVAVIGGFLYSPTQDTEHKNIRQEIEHIHREFPSQLAHIWVQFSAGIRETAEETPTKPSVFMLLYETDERTPVCLAQKISIISANILDAVTKHPPLIIDGADLEHNETLAEDYGILIQEYCPKVEEQRALIVHNLHKIPGTVAQSFHSLCDTVNPAVGKAVYLFTMKASGVSSNVDNPTKVAEEELRKLWSHKLNEGILNPLITRITDTVMVIKPENNMASCES